MTFLTMAVLSGTLCLQNAPAAQGAVDEQTAVEAVAKFKEEFKVARTEEEKIPLVQKLGAVRHAKTRQALIQILGAPYEAGVRIAAADALGTFRGVSGTSQILLSMLGSPVLSKEKDVKKAILRALGELRAENAVNALLQIMQQRPYDVAREAVLALGKIRKKESIPALIAFLEKVEQPPGTTEVNPLGNVPYLPPNVPFKDPGGNLGNLPSVGGAIGGAGGIGGATGNNTAKDQMERQQMLLEALNKALAAITNEKWTTSKEWEIWWKRNASTFQVQK